MATKPIIKRSSIKARWLLAEALLVLATAGAFWYTIDGNQTLLCALMTRLGFASEFEWFSFLHTANLANYKRQSDGSYRFAIKYSVWMTFLSQDGGYGLSKDLFSISRNHLDWESFIEGSTQDGTQDRVYSVRIGHKDGHWTNSITDQTKDSYPPKKI